MTSFSAAADRSRLRLAYIHRRWHIYVARWSQAKQTLVHDDIKTNFDGLNYVQPEQLVEHQLREPINSSLPVL
jgi:hypothetical protein